MGLLLSGLAIAPPLISYYMDQEWSMVQPAIKLTKKLLEREYKKKIIKKLTFNNLEILLDSIHKNLESAVVLVTVLGAFNFCMDLLMLIGSCFEIR